MGDLDIGLAMVTARIATSEIKREQEQETRKKRGKGAAVRGSGRDAGAKRSLRGVELEFVKGELVLIPSVEAERKVRTRGWTVTRKDGSVVRIDTGEVVQPPKED
jgi:hypothetical protein